MLRILIVLILCLCQYQATSRSLKVCKSCETGTIKAALQKAADHDTIFIQSGNYAEGNIIIDKPVHLVGIGYPVIDGQGKVEVITIKTNGASITGLKIINSGNSSLNDLAGIKVLKSKNVTITNNILYNNCFGIYLSNCSGSIIQNNTVTGTGTGQQSSGNGIHLWKCNTIKILNNTIKGQRDGIYFEFVTASLIRGNHSETNLRYGLHFMFSDDDTYEDNTFVNNGAGVAVMYTKNVKMYRNKFLLNWGSGSYAILLKDIRDSEIKGNIFKGNTTGIFAEGSSRVNILSNDFIGNGWALKLTSSCDAIKLHGNNFSGNTFDMATNGNNSMTVNNFDGNYWDKYTGYDLNKDQTGDVPYHPVSLSNLLVEKIPASVYFLHSFVLDLIDQSEKLIPSLTPEDIADKKPSMKKFKL